MPRICFVTFELSPFTGGGIGTWLANSLKTYDTADCQYEVLYYGQQRISHVEFEAIYPSVKLHSLDDLHYPHPPKLHQEFDSVRVWQSYSIMRKLQGLESLSGPFDVIEFVDWAGPGYFAIQQKKLGRNFLQTDLNVRLHGSEEMLRQYEGRRWAQENLQISDLEHQAIADADHCVTHLIGNAKEYQRVYRLPDAWLNRCIVELPPLGNQRKADSTITLHSKTSLAFSSKFQGLKRPTVFAQAAAEFMAGCPDYKGSGIFAAFIADADEIDIVRRLVPSSLQDRFEFLSTSSAEVRHRIIANSVTIFTGAFETFCFAAYEASLAGSIVVLNEKNPAFGNETPWIDHKNCLKFDGSVNGLQNLLDGLFSFDGGHIGSLKPIDYSHEPTPYWFRKKKAESAALTANSTPHCPISVVIPNRGGAGELLTQVQDLISLADREVEIVIVDGGSEDAATRHVLELLAAPTNASSKAEIRVIRRTAASTYPVLANAGLAAAQYDVVAMLPNRQRDSSGFIFSGSEAIASGRCDIVLPTIRLIDEHDALDVQTFWLPLGAALRTNMFLNRLSFGSFVAKKKVIQDEGFDESLQAEWSWDILLRLAYSERQFAVDVDCGPEVARVDIERWEPQCEVVRRLALEAIRRNVWRKSPRLDFPWTSLGDGELTSHSRYLTKGDRGRIDSLQEYENLANARTVRWALWLGNTAKKMLGR